MDYNSLNSNAFDFALTRLPKTAFRVVQVNIPSIQIPAPEAGFMQGMQYFPGSATEFGTFNMTFVVDENLENYEELYRWIMQQRFLEPFNPVSSEERFLVSDAVLVTLTNSSNPNRTFEFKDMFPVSLGDINFDVRDQSVEPVTCTAEFRFSEFRLVPK